MKKNHPYDVPEVISTSIENGHKPYLDWIGKIVPENVEGSSGEKKQKLDGDD